MRYVSLDLEMSGSDPLLQETSNNLNLNWEGEMRIRRLDILAGVLSTLLASSAMAQDAAPPVAPGETVIRATVTLTARLK